jgi:hypothetical protein
MFHKSEVLLVLDMGYRYAVMFIGHSPTYPISDSWNVSKVTFLNTWVMVVKELYHRVQNFMHNHEILPCFKAAVLSYETLLVWILRM